MTASIILGAYSIADGFTGAAQAALLRLRRDGASLDELTMIAAADGAVGLTAFQTALEQLAQRGLLWYCAVGQNRPLVSTSGASALLTFPPLREPRFVLSRFALMRRTGERMIIESPLSPHEVQIHDARVMALFAGLWSGLAEEEIAVIGSLFTSCGILADRDDAPPLALWEFHNLLFHTRSRMGRNRAGVGATYRFYGISEPLPAHKPPMSDQAIDLDVPDIERLRIEDATLTKVLEDRRSVRHYGDPPISRRQLGEFLYRTARETRTSSSASVPEHISRPYPGGGALYELEIYLSVRSCVDLPPGLFHYAPSEHRLYKIAPLAATDLLLQAAGASIDADPPQVLVTIAARFGRVFWTYEALGYALILKDVGVLLQTMCLVAEATSLGACAIGAGDSDAFAIAAGLDYYAETSVGELALGTRGSG